MMENTIDSIGAAVYVYELAYRAVKANTEHTHNFKMVIDLKSSSSSLAFVRNSRTIDTFRSFTVRSLSIQADKWDERMALYVCAESANAQLDHKYVLCVCAVRVNVRAPSLIAMYTSHTYLFSGEIQMHI